MYVPDNYDAFVWHSAEQEREEKEWRSRLPVCCECGEPIEDDDCYDFGGDLYCPDCVYGHKKPTANYMKGE